MIETYLLDTHTLPDPMEFPEGLKKISDERAEKIYRLKHPQARKQCFGAGLLLEYGLRQASACDIINENINIYSEDSRCLSQQIGFHSYGKPYLSQIPFNLSHTENYVIVSIQMSKEKMDPAHISIGCDIERIKTYDPRIARRFFTKTEYQKLEETDSRQQAALFCRYWTRKESVMKMTGLGMALPMDLFDISSGLEVAADREKILMWQESAKEKMSAEVYAAAQLLLGGNLYLTEYLYDEYFITVCSNGRQFAKELSIVCADQA